MHVACTCGLLLRQWQVRGSASAGLPCTAFEVLQGGSIFVMQEAGLTTTAVKQSPLTMVAALPALVTAGAGNGAGQGPVRLAGYMYNDDGESIQVCGW